MTTHEITKMKTDELWLLWETDKNQLIKDELVIRHLQLVEQVAGRIRIGLPASVQLDELVNSGIIGLIASVDNYDLSRGFKFSTFAVNRIRGSILDSLRDYDWMPRSIRTKTKSLEAALVKLEGQLRRVPTDEEVADELNLDVDSYYSLLDEVKVASIMSLDQPISGPDGEKSSLVNLLEDEDAEDPRERVEWLEAKEETKKLIQGLSQQERLVIALYYYEELTLKEVGNVLEISESRVSQIHSKVILTLKGKLRHMFDDKIDR
jgi:RNA polymerase sigma factor FliA